MEGAQAGINIEMGSDLPMMGRGEPVDYSKFFLGDTIISLVENKVIDEELVNAKVRRILWVMHKLGKFDSAASAGTGAYNTPAHQKVARSIADEAITLLKNEAILPLAKEGLQTVAVVGANANRKHAGGGGSSQVKAFYEVTPLEGLTALLGENVTINYAPGYEVVRENGTSQAMIDAAVAAVSNADAAIYVGGWIHGYTDEWNDNAYDAEVVDKPSMHLPFGQDALIKAVLAANPNTVIVMMGGGPIDMRPWGDQAKSIVQAWYPGMEGGHALAAVLFGDVNPSGKLPMTFPVKLEDSPAHSVAQYPDENLLIDHKEGIFVGYRYFDTYEVEPAFAFGHGLSYTTFAYEDLQVSKEGEEVKVQLTVKNTGDRRGGEIVQIYVKDPVSNVERPTQELKAFDKVWLDAGESTQVQATLDASAFSYYDENKQAWVLEPGVFNIAVGSSSRDIRLTADVNW